MRCPRRPSWPERCFLFSTERAARRAGPIRYKEDEASSARCLIAAQTIYYPGFTIGGASEALAIVGTIALLLPTPAGTPVFWLTLTAMVSMLATQLVFWVMTQPANRYWLRTQQLKGVAAKFFSADMKLRPADGRNRTRAYRRDC